MLIVHKGYISLALWLASNVLYFLEYFPLLKMFLYHMSGSHMS